MEFIAGDPRVLSLAEFTDRPDQFAYFVMLFDRSPDRFVRDIDAIMLL